MNSETPTERALEVEVRRLRGRVGELEAAQRISSEVIEKSPGMISVVRGPELVYELVNPAFQSLAPGRQLLGRRFCDVWPEVADLMVAIQRNVLQTGREYQIDDVRYIIQRGPDTPPEVVHLSFLHIPLPGPDGKPEGILTLGAEVTDTVRKRRAEESLEASEHRFRALLESMTEGFALFEIGEAAGKPGELLPVALNPAFERHTGISGAELHKRTAPDLLGEVAPEWIEGLYHVARSGERACVETQSGSPPRWLEATVFPAEAGRFGMLIADITERKRKHEQTRELFRSLFENLLNAYAYCRMVFEDGKPRDFIFLAVNQAFEVQCGLKDVVGRRVTEVIPGIRETDPQLFEIYGRVAATGRPELFETFIQALSAWFSVSAYCPEHEHFVIVFDQITERKRSEEALRASEQRYRTLANSGQALIWTSTPDTKCDYFNQPWLDFTGCSLALELGRGWADGVHPEDQGSCLQIYSAAFDRREAYAMEYRRRRHDGEYRWLREAGTPHYDHDGRFLGYIGHCLDITERKQAEEAQRESARQMESALLEKTVLLQEIHHRVKNNLAVTDSLLNLKAENSPPEARQALQESRQRVHSIALVHEHLYSSDRLDRVDFGECARALARGVYSACTEPGRIGLDLDIDSIEVGIERAVPCALILNELLSNSFKHAFADGRAGRIRLSFHRSDPGWGELAVEDDGVGLPAGYLEGRPNSLGFRIVEILSHQVDGSVTQRDGPGTRIVLRFPSRLGTG